MYLHTHPDTYIHTCLHTRTHVRTYVLVYLRKHLHLNTDAKPPPLPKGWVEKEDANGKIYYDNRITHQTQWDRPVPKDFTDAAKLALRRLPPVKFVLGGHDDQAGSGKEHDRLKGSKGKDANTPRGA